MCGIAGWQLKETEEGLTIFEKTVIALTLAEEMEQRGRDSFGGALWFEQGKDPVIFRKTGRVLLGGRQMLEQATFTHQFLMHTRAATVGAVTEMNCHPFQCGSTLGVHNGGVANYAELNRKLDRKFDVDSQHIFAHIEEKRDLSEIQAYGAIVFTNDNSSLNLCRFNHGVLSAARIYRKAPNKEREKEHIGVVFASREDAIQKAMERCGLFYALLELVSDDVYQAFKGELFKTKHEVNFASSTKTSSSTGNSSCAVVRRAATDQHFSHGVEPERRKIITGPDGKQLNKRERKRIKRMLRAGDGKNEATCFNAFNRLQKCYMFEDIEGNDGKNYKIALCPDCNCDILMHYAGKCLTPESECKRTHCPTFQPCGSCGCYLVDQTHILEMVDDVPLLYCEICEEPCPIEQAKRRISLDEDASAHSTEGEELQGPPTNDNKRVGLVIVGGGGAQEDTDEINLEDITDDDLRDSTRLGKLLRRFRENGEWEGMADN